MGFVFRKKIRNFKGFSAVKDEATNLYGLKTDYNDVFVYPSIFSDIEFKNEIVYFEKDGLTAVLPFDVLLSKVPEEELSRYKLYTFGHKVPIDALSSHEAITWMCVDKKGTCPMFAAGDIVIIPSDYKCYRAISEKPWAEEYIDVIVCKNLAKCKRKTFPVSHFFRVYEEKLSRPIYSRVGLKEEYRRHDYTGEVIRRLGLFNEYDCLITGKNINLNERLMNVVDKPFIVGEWSQDPWSSNYSQSLDFIHDKDTISKIEELIRIQLSEKESSKV